MVTYSNMYYKILSRAYLSSDTTIKTHSKHILPPSCEKCNPVFEKNSTKSTILRTTVAPAIYRPLATINRPSILTCEHMLKKLFSLHFLE
jgi:hypothetical protein